MLYNDERPYRFNDVVGQDMIVENIRSQAKKEKFFQVYVLGGQYGSGKTTMARIIALAANCQHKDEDGNPCLECEECRSILEGSCIDVIEIDGASNNGVDQVRELTANMSYIPAMLKYKVVIIDEVHMLSKAAFNAFLKTLEEPPEYCIFILCTTEVNAIPATVRSRSANYSFRRISTEDICCHIERVAEKHGILLDKDAGKLIAKNADGAMRNALALLEQCMMVSEHITADTIKNLLGIESAESCFALLNALSAMDTVKVVKMAEQFYASGRNMSVILRDMLEIVSDTIMFLSGAENSIVNTDGYVASIKELASSATLDEFFTMSAMLSELKNSLRTDDSRSSVIVAFVKMTKHLDADYDTLLARISALEKELEELKENGVQTFRNEESTAVQEHTDERTDSDGWEVCADECAFSEEDAESTVVSGSKEDGKDKCDFCDNEASLLCDKPSELVIFTAAGETDVADDVPSSGNESLADDALFEYYSGCAEEPGYAGDYAEEPNMYEDTVPVESYADEAESTAEILENAEEPSCADNNIAGNEAQAESCTDEAGTDESSDEGGSFGFDYMSLFGMDTGSRQDKAEKPSAAPKGGSEKKTAADAETSVPNNGAGQNALETLKSDRAISAAIERNCKAVENPDGSVVLYTAHMPVQKIIQAYIAAHGMDNIEVVLDAEKSL